jgi:NitT/TauT family transport system ATP-binding protein
VEGIRRLDPGVTADMHELILRLREENRMTIFMVSHDIQESFLLGTRLLTLDKLRHDPQSPEAYGASVTYDMPLKRPKLASAAMAWISTSTKCTSARATPARRS